MKPPATKPEQLVVRTWTGPFEKALTEGPVRTFTDETGIEVKFNRTYETETFTQTQTAIRAGDRPPLDVEWSTSIFGVLSTVQGLLTPMNPQIVTNFGSVNPKTAQPPDGSSSWVGGYTYSVPIVHRTDLIAPGTFDSWEVLWEPDYERSISFCDVIICTLPTVSKLAGVNMATDDMSPVWAKYRELTPNIGLIGGLSIQPLIEGEAKILIDLVSYGVEGKTAGEPIGWQVPQEGATVDRDAFWVLNNVPEDVKYYGQVFINHVLDPANQEIIADKLGVIPVNRDAALPEYMNEDPAAFPFTEEDVDKYAIIGDTIAMARHNDEWQRELEQALKG